MIDATWIDVKTALLSYGSRAPSLHLSSGSQEFLNLFLDLFGNGRTARVVLEEMIQRQARRLSALPDPTREDLLALLAEDLES